MWELRLQLLSSRPGGARRPARWRDREVVLARWRDREVVEVLCEHFQAQLTQGTWLQPLATSFGRCSILRQIWPGLTEEEPCAVRVETQELSEDSATGFTTRSQAAQMEGRPGGRAPGVDNREIAACPRGLTANAGRVPDIGNAAIAICHHLQRRPNQQGLRA